MEVRQGREEEGRGLTPEKNSKRDVVYIESRQTKTPTSRNGGRRPATSAKRLLERGGLGVGVMYPSSPSTTAPQPHTIANRDPKKGTVVAK